MAKVARYSLITLLLTMLAGCGSQPLLRISGEPPQWQVRSLARDGQNVEAVLSLRNVNDQPLELARLTIDLRIGDEPLIQIERDMNQVVPSRGRESVTLELTAALAGLEQLERLAGGEVNALPWTLAGECFIAGGRTYPVDATGYLYRVPGRPDRFR